MNGMPKRLLATLLILLATVCTVLLQSESYARANTITVNSLADSTVSGDGLCTLREAIINANAGTDQTGGDCTAGSGTDTINFSLSGTITLGSTLPTIANVSPNTLTIDGAGQTITIDGANLYTILSLADGAALNLNKLAITHGNGGAIGGSGVYAIGRSLAITNCTFSTNLALGGFGGAIFNSGGSVLTVDNTIFSDNSVGNGGSGGAIGAVTGPVKITNTTFSGNSGGVGGAIFDFSTSDGLFVSDSTFTSNSSGTVALGGNGGGIACIKGSVTNSTFANNSAGTNGGGIVCTDAIVNNSTFSGNSARFGGGILAGSNLTVTNCTFSGNTSYLGVGQGGGGILAENSTVTVSNSTFSGNSGSDGGGIYDDASNFTITSSILATNSPGGNCFAVNGPALINGGHNISDDATCGFGTSTSASGKTIGDNVDPLLAVAGLQDNGGPTHTIALQSTSHAINGIPKALCPATDQRGALRPATGHTACTIGAFEYAGVIPTPAFTISPTSLGFLTVGIGTTKSLTLTIKNTAKGGTLTGNVPTLAAPFNVTAGSGPFSLAAGQVRSVTVQFTPTTPVAVTTNLVITSNDPKKPSVSVKVTGAGQAGQLSVPSLLTFLSKATVPKTSTLTIRNLGLGVLHGNVGAATGPFVVSAGGGAFTLYHSQTKVVTIQFTPPAKGPFTDSLPLLSDDPKHLSFNVNLKGTGQ